MKLIFILLLSLSAAQSALADGWFRSETIAQNLCPKSGCAAIGYEMREHRCEFWRYSSSRPGEVFALGPWQTQSTHCSCPCTPSAYDEYAEEAKR